MKKLVIFDMDGTIYLGKNLIDGSLETFQTLKNDNVEYVFFTNNSSHDLDFYFDKIKNFGIECDREKNFYSSTEVAISYLKDHNPKRLYNYYGYGGYLISKNIKVFVDGRCDLYSDYNYRDYYNISILSFGFDKLIKKYDFDYFIIPSDFGLSTYLSNNNSYQLVYKDKNTVIFKLLNN